MGPRSPCRAGPVPAPLVWMKTPEDMEPVARAPEAREGSAQSCGGTGPEDSCRGRRGCSSGASRSPGQHGLGARAGHRRSEQT